MTDTKIRCTLYLTILLLLATLLAACQPDTIAPGDTTAKPDQQSPVVDVSPEGPTIEQTWQSSPHADTFVETATGKNNLCARCHAPAVFVPTMDDIPESCFTCKFEISPPPPYIPKEEWSNIECNVCHLVKKDGEVEPEYAWLLFLMIQEYEEVSSSTELCGKCHADVDLDLPDHEAISVRGAHADFTCTDCHDAHVLTTSCGAAGCHDEIQEISGHDEDHETVTCGACHDASDLEVGPDEDLGVWLTYLPADAEGVSTPFVSHNTQLEVSCDRCHFSDNPWDLSDDVTTP